ncbi:TPA: hypothetical protein RG685_000689 [Morganella morganii]|nr:hypothetical protein [Morganella morganii]
MAAALFGIPPAAGRNKKPHTALVLSDNEVIDTVAAYMKKPHMATFGIRITFNSHNKYLIDKSIKDTFACLIVFQTYYG